MAGAACTTLLVLIVTLCSPGCGWAEKPLRPQHGRQTAVVKTHRERWEPSIHLDGKPVERFVINSNKSLRSHRFSKVSKDSQSHLLEDVDPEWVNLDGFAVLGGAPVKNSSAAVQTSQGTFRQTSAVRPSHQVVERTTRVHRTTHDSLGQFHRRAPQSSSGPKQPDRSWPGAPLLERRRQHNIKPRSDQRKRHAHKITSESVHVVSLQAQKAQGQSTPVIRAIAPKTTTQEPPEYVAQDISVRVMSPQSVLISWVDPAVEMGKVSPGDSRAYTIKYREKGESARWEYKESSQRRMLIDSLSADSMYEFSVRISREENHGKWSVSVFQRTPESAPSGPPENFDVKPLRGKGTAVIATWDPPEEPNGRIKEYILSYAPSMKPFGMKSVTYRGSTTTATVEGLTPGDRYIFKIRATNRRGMGPQSKAFSVAMPGSSNAASKDKHRTSHTPSKQDTNQDDSNFQSTEAPQKTTTTTQQPPAPPVKRLTRPLSQTRSYHSIFSSVRGSVRNTVNRESNNGKVEEKEEEEEEEGGKPPTTEETDTVPKTYQPNIIASTTAKTSILKFVTAPPTKPSPRKRRPYKIRIHQKSPSKASSSDATLKPLSSPSTISLFSSHPQESALGRKNYVTSTDGGTKNMYDKPSLSKTKTMPEVKKETNNGQTDNASRGRDSPLSGQNIGSGFASRYGNGRRQSGSLSRVSSTRPSDFRNLATPHTPTSKSTSQRILHEQAFSQNTYSGITPKEDNYKTNSEEIKSNGKVSDPKTHSTDEKQKGDEERKENTNQKPSISRARINPSFAERFPWLASRYPGRVGSGTRTSSSRQDGRTSGNRVSSSVGSGRPVLKENLTRLSGAKDTTGVSSIQETTEEVESPSSPDSIKTLIGESSVKPSLNVQDESSSQPNTREHGDSSKNKGISNENNDRFTGYFHEQSGVISGTNTSKETAGTHTQSIPAENNKSVGARDTPSKLKPDTLPAPVQPHHRPGMVWNGRVRGSLLPNRPRLPFKLQQEQNPRFGSSKSQTSTSSTASSSSSDMHQSVLKSEDVVANAGGNSGVRSQSTMLTSRTLSSPSRDSLRNNGERPRYTIRGKPISGERLKPVNGNGKIERPNLTTTDNKESSSSQGTSKAAGQKFITGPDGTQWVVDLELGLLMNQDGKVLQDSNGKPKRVVVGEDGRTIFDHMGSPLVNQEGVVLFGHGRDSQPVINPKEKVLMVGGKPVVGLNPPRSRIRTSTKAPSTTKQPTTPKRTTVVYTTSMPYPTCPPGTYSKTDEYGNSVLDPEGVLDCYLEEESSGMEMDLMVPGTMLPDALDLEKDEFLVQTTLRPYPTTTGVPASEAHTRPPFKGPTSEFDLSGKKRFTAPYVNYIRKDPASPCSLTEALEFLQVDVLENLIEKDSLAADQNQPPKNKPHNLTVVAMEGCHSFIILDWARPLKDDMVSGYLVYSASYDDVLNNRWSSQSSSGTHLAVENLKPNSRYYFKVQAKNVFGLGPVSDTLTYVTESDDPLLIERPPGGEPIWIPFTFKFNSAHSSCKGSQYVKRTWYRKFVGVVLCNSLRYKIFMGENLREPFYSIGDTFGEGEDHCQFVDSYRDGRTGPSYLSNHLPSAQGFYRAYRQQPVTFGVIGRRTPHPFVGWYECGVPIPGKW
ncbi:fibronectin type III domain-containing protein 1 isoform X2 [Gouania willdenowi]|uniref:fibronectin type III domain-containing protein 1 isoform X2 n=1 Tax=Gouania willdenowi TaxID=441366 RepID=UPI00105439CC|nr:fibronectin type III domain-containing protein 1 isoform X2 [Gouania willdenowi]